MMVRSQCRSLRLFEVILESDQVPVSYMIDPTRKLIRTTCSGPITLANVIEHFRELKDDPACVGHLDVLLDVDAAESPPESDQLRTVNSQLRQMHKKVQFGMLAIVAKRDVMFGMMRVFRVFAEENFRAIRVFREAREAEAWLSSREADDIYS